MIEQSIDTNIFTYRFDYQPPYGGEIKTAQESTKIKNGGNMKDILEKYRLFLGVKYRKQNSQAIYLNSALFQPGFCNIYRDICFPICSNPSKGGWG